MVHPSQRDVTPGWSDSCIPQGSKLRFLQCARLPLPQPRPNRDSPEDPASLPPCPCKLHVGLEASLPVARAPGERVGRWAAQETTGRGTNPSLTAFSILPAHLGSVPPKRGAGRKSLGPPLPSRDTSPPWFRTWALEASGKDIPNPEASFLFAFFLFKPEL